MNRVNAWISEATATNNSRALGSKAMTKTRTALISTAIVAILLAGLVFEVVTTQPVRGAMRTCSELFTIANRLELTEPDAARATRAMLGGARRALLGSLPSHRIRWPWPPKGESSAFRATSTRTSKRGEKDRTSGSVPTNRIGPVYQFVFEDGRWRFDGLVAILGPWGEIVRTQDLTNAVAE